MKIVEVIGDGNYGTKAVLFRGAVENENWQLYGNGTILTWIQEYIRRPNGGELKVIVREVNENESS
jgi:hypothetical protein